MADDEEARLYYFSPPDLDEYHQKLQELIPALETETGFRYRFNKDGGHGVEACVLNLDEKTFAAHIYIRVLDWSRSIKVKIISQDKNKCPDEKLEGILSKLAPAGHKLVSSEERRKYVRHSD
ncbi:MAG: hypothetical protein V1839_03645 [archaeon]